MGFSLAPIDTTIIGNHVSIVFKNDPKPQGDGFPLGGGTPLPLQFPPKITDDTKTANWNDIDLGTYEPLPIFKGSSARRITIECVYIVTGSANGRMGNGAGSSFGGPTVGGSISSGNQWNTKFIAQVTKQVKAYFYRSIAAGDNIPILNVRFYNHVGEGSGGPEANFRLTDVNITHGETLINDSQGVFPLFTKIRMTALLTTQLRTGDDTNGNVPKFDVAVAPKPKAQWY